jgi:hypothetical protein
MGKNQDPGSGINIPDPQHWIFARPTLPSLIDLEFFSMAERQMASLRSVSALARNTSPRFRLLVLFPRSSSSSKIVSFSASSCRGKGQVVFVPSYFKRTLRIHDILVWIRIRGSMPLTDR